MEKDNKSIFISYRRSDSAGHTGRLFDYLSANLSYNIFMDVQGINPGEFWKDIIKQQVESCAVLLIIIGQNWLYSKDKYGRRRLDLPHDPVRYEIEIAIKTPSIRVIPILVGGAELPEQLGLPDGLTDILEANAFKIDDDSFHDDAERLARKIRTFLEPTILIKQSKLNIRGITFRDLEIPKSWRFGKLGEVATIKMGNIIQRDMPSGAYPLYGASGIVEYIDQVGFDEPSILISSTMANNPSIFRVEGSFSAIQRMFVIIPHTGISIDYLYIIMKYYDWELIKHLSSIGTSISHISRNTLKDLYIPLPNLDEQVKFYERVSNIVNQVETIRESLIFQLGIVDEMEISLIKKLFQKGVTNG